MINKMMILAAVVFGLTFLGGYIVIQLIMFAIELFKVFATCMAETNSFWGCIAR